MFLLQPVDQINQAVKPAAFATTDGVCSHGYGQMCLAGSGSTDQHKYCGNHSGNYPDTGYAPAAH